MESKAIVKLDDSARREIAVQISKGIPDAECRDLVAFIDKLLAIRRSDQSYARKLKSTLAETLNVKIIWPALKILALEFKRRIWDKTSPNSKLGIAGALIGLTFFAGGAAGIAAMGSAISVPLWVVFGAGAMYAGYLRDALVRRIEEWSAPTIDI